MRVIYLVPFIILLTSCGGGDNDRFGAGAVTYKITLDSSWSSQTHPVDFPSTPHFSRLVGATHNVNTKFWSEGNIASSGIESMAESGGTSILLSEIQSNITLGDSNTQILSSGIASSPGSTSFILKPDSSFTYLTLVTMLAPSPDWFVGVSAYNLMPNGNWLTKEIIVLFAYDAGGDNGVTYASSDSDSNPKIAISKIITSPFLVDGKITPIGALTIERIVN